MAMKNAASKAQILARGAGVALGKLKLVRERVERSDGEQPFLMAKRTFEAAAMADGASAGPSVDARPLDLRVEITAQYDLD